jgi:hypothetical protein
MQAIQLADSSDLPMKRFENWPRDAATQGVILALGRLEIRPAFDMEPAVVAAHPVESKFLVLLSHLSDHLLPMPEEEDRLPIKTEASRLVDC